MAQEIDLRALDRRILDRLLKRGEISEKDVEKALKQLPDMAEEGEATQSKFERRGDGA